jgi:hypothetical protein
MGSRGGSPRPQAGGVGSRPMAIAQAARISEGVCPLDERSFIVMVFILMESHPLMTVSAATLLLKAPHDMRGVFRSYP